MGIKGLLTFAQHKIAPERVVIVSSSESESESPALQGHSCKTPGGALVVDAIGFALYSYDQLAPRSFRALASHVEDFARTLVRCGMRVVFVFDGGVDACKRASTIRRRREEAARPGRHPFAIEICLRLVLARLSSAWPEQLSYVDAPLEADGVLAALSRDLQCPILSNDSDFLVYGNTHGLVLFSMINVGAFGPQSELACVMRVFHSARLAQALHVGAADLVVIAALVSPDNNAAAAAADASMPLQHAVNRVCAASLKKPPVYTAQERQRIAAAQARYANQDALVAPPTRPPADFRFSCTVADAGEFWWPRGALAGFNHAVLLGDNARAVVDPWCAALFAKHARQPTVKEYCPPLYAVRNVAVAANAKDYFAHDEAAEPAMKRAAAVLRRRLPHVAEWEWAALLQPPHDAPPPSPRGASDGDARPRAYALLEVLVLAASLDACVFGSDLADLCALDQPACVAEYARQHAQRAMAP